MFKKGVVRVLEKYTIAGTLSVLYSTRCTFKVSDRYMLGFQCTFCYIFATESNAPLSVTHRLLRSLRHLINLILLIHSQLNSIPVNETRVTSLLKA